MLAQFRYQNLSLKLFGKISTGDGAALYRILNKTIDRG